VPRPRLVTQDEGPPGSSEPVLRFDGEPGDVQALVAIPSAERLSVKVFVDLPGDLGGAVRTLTAPLHADWTTVRLLLPDQTPEGEYAARLDWSGGSIPAMVVVREHVRVHVVPPSLKVRAGAGRAVGAQVTLYNAGNVALDVRKVFPIALEHIQALDRAIIAGLTSKQTHLDRLGVLADSLASDQVGVVRAVVLEGGGTLAPGQTQQLVLELRMPETLEAGTTYSGLWLVGGVDVPLVVDAVARPEDNAPPVAAKARASRPSKKEKS
jgi:hypothetical protein